MLYDLFYISQGISICPTYVKLQNIIRNKKYFETEIFLGWISFIFKTWVENRRVRLKKYNHFLILDQQSSISGNMSFFYFQKHKKASSLESIRILILEPKFPFPEIQGIFSGGFFYFFGLGLESVPSRPILH